MLRHNSVGFLWARTHLKRFPSSVSILMWVSDLTVSPLGIASTTITPSQSQKTTDHDHIHWWKVLNFFLPGRLRIVSFHGLNFCLRFKITDPGITRCNIPRQEGFSLSFKTRQSWGKDFSLGFVFECKAPRDPCRAHLPGSKIWNDVTIISFADWKTECHLSSCDASIHANDRISTLRHFRTNSLKRTA